MAARYHDIEAVMSCAFKQRIRISIISICPDGLTPRARALQPTDAKAHHLPAGRDEGPDVEHASFSAVLTAHAVHEGIDVAEDVNQIVWVVDVSALAEAAGASVVRWWWPNSTVCHATWPSSPG